MSREALQKILPVPSFFDLESVGKVWKVSYQERAEQAKKWAQNYQLRPAAQDDVKVALLLIDVQNTFCIPEYELFVGGRSGRGAVEDNRRLCEFIYRNLGVITRVYASLDTHKAMQIFHPIMLVDGEGNHPDPLTLISYQDVFEGRWKFNPELAGMLGFEADYGQRHLLHYTQELEQREKYALTIWPYHAMLGGIGHALVPAVEEAVFFHTVARLSQVDFEIKGEESLTEHYSILGPEVTEGPRGRKLGEKSSKFLQVVREYEAVVIAGQAKSHCVAWTISDLLGEIRSIDETLTQKIYLLEDCSSPVVVPGVVDYTEQADAEYRRFEEAGMHLVESTIPMTGWPGWADR